MKHRIKNFMSMLLVFVVLGTSVLAGASSVSAIVTNTNGISVETEETQTDKIEITEDSIVVSDEPGHGEMEVEAVEEELDASAATIDSESKDDNSIEIGSTSEFITGEPLALGIEAFRIPSIFIAESEDNTDFKTEEVSDFASMRLILLTDDDSVIKDDDTIIGQYDDFYLLEFPSVQETMNAYVYYRDKVTAIEPDKTVEVATDDSVSDDGISIINEKPIATDEETNPINALHNVEDSVDTQDADNVIALIDTGTSKHANVIDRVSVIDDILMGENSHADDMVTAIVSQNKKAKILSIRAMNDNGLGTISSLVAAMEYAIDQQVSIINLSLYGKTTLSTSVLEQEILKATEAGILVVGAAGNDGADVADYMPGSVAEAWIIGACDKDGSRLTGSNYGKTVDYNVVADSTSEAAAKFAGYISKYGVDSIVVNDGLIYTTDYLNDEIDIDEIIKADEQLHTVRFDIPKVGGMVIVQTDAEGSSKSRIVPKSKGDDLVFNENEGVTIKTEVTCDEGYDIASYKVLSASGKELEVITEFDDTDIYEHEFTIPDEDINVEIIFKEDGKSTVKDETAGKDGLTESQRYLKDRGYPEFVWENASDDDFLTDGVSYAEDEFQLAASHAPVTLRNHGQHSYPTGTYSTGYYTVDGAIGTAYCMDPVNSSPGTGTYSNIVCLDDTEPSNAKWYKFCMLLDYGMPLESVGNNVFGAADQGQKAYREVYIHALIGYKNQGVLPGVNSGEQAGIRNIYNYIYPRCMNGEWDSIINQYTAYKIVVGGNKQDICFLEYVPAADLTITKRSETDLSAGRGEMRLTGAVFQLYGWNSSANSYNRYIGNFTDNGNGTYTIKGVRTSQGDNGYFLVKEYAPPRGYQPNYYKFSSTDTSDYNTYGGRQFKLDGTTWSCYTLRNYEHPSWGFVFLNTPNTNQFNVTKIDADTGAKLKGAEFTLYGWNSTTNRYDIDLGKFTDNGDGTYTSPRFSIDRGDNRKYLVKETKAPTDYYLSPEGSNDSDFKTYGGRQITLDVDGNITGNPNLIFANKPMNGFLKLKKVSALPDITDGNKCYSLEGAKYGVYSDAACKTSVGTLTTDKDGNSNTLSIKHGTYYVKEIEASQGYELDETVYKVVVEPSKTTVVNSENGGTVEEYPGNDPAGIQMTKIWNGDETATIPTLEGTQFTVKYYDGYYDKSNLPDTATRTWVIEVKKASNGMYITMLDPSYVVADLSDDFYYDGNAVVLPYGTITIQETKHAAGYTFNGYLADKDGNTVSTDSELYIAQITKDTGAVKLSGGNEYSASDTPIFGSIKLKKYDTDGKTALQGVTFEIKNAKGEVVATATTDSNGEVLFDDLYPDVYTITETKTVAGHTLLKEPITAEIPMRVTEQDIKDNNIDKSQCIYDEADDIYYIYNQTYEISNGVTFEYPMTGGIYTVWTFLPMAAGFAMLAVLMVVILRKKRRV